MNSKLKNFIYFLIIEIEEMQKSFKEIYLIKNEFCLILNIIIYSKDENLFIDKRALQIPCLPIFIANTKEEIINYINSQEYLNCGVNTFEMGDDNDKMNNDSENMELIFGKKIEEKIENNIEEIIEGKAIEDSWEVIENIPKIIFEKKLFCIDWTDSIREMKRNMLKMLKENKIGIDDNEKYKYLKYFGFTLFPEIQSLFIDIIVKHFCYAYSRDEGKNIPSFYYILNKELRTANSSKINILFQ